MKYPSLIRAAAVVAAMGVGCVLAQTPPLVLSDAAPPGPEDRSSVGAVVLDSSPTKTREAGFARPDTQRMGAGPANRSSVRAKAKLQAEADAKRAREIEWFERHRTDPGSVQER